VHRRSFAAGALVAALAMILLAPAVQADTCCANKAVRFSPSSATPGDTVRIDRIVCRDAYNDGPLELNLVSWWLSSDDIPAADPGDVPGSPDVHLADDLPRVGRWHPFASVSDPGVATAGSATIVIPTMSPGTYQLWWRCDNGGGRGSGIHYSGGPRLAVGVPDTAAGAAPTQVVTPSRPSTLPILLLAGLVGLAVMLRRVRRA
jgi:hypothetical protein